MGNDYHGPVPANPYRRLAAILLLSGLAVAALITGLVAWRVNTGEAMLALVEIVVICLGGASALGLLLAAAVVWRTSSKFQALVGGEGLLATWTCRLRGDGGGRPSERDPDPGSARCP
jgi:hypothetical protein